MHLPIGVSLILGKMIGFFLYCSPRKRHQAFRNIKLVFPQKNKKATQSILRRSFINLGLSIIESFIVSRIFKYVELKGKEKIQDEGQILVGIHEGSWEVSNCFLAQHFNYVILARQQKDKGLDRLLNETRRKANLEVCLSLKELLKFVKKNYFLGLVIDHGAEENAPFIPFFSHPVPTPTGAAHLAKKFKKNIYPCFVYRKRNFSHCIEIGDPISAQHKDEREILAELHSFYEKMLREHPDEYIWSFKRFKRKNDLEVVILSDRKPGHLKQSRALLSFLREQDLEINEQIIEIDYKNKLTRLFSEICALTSGKRCCLGCGACLKFLVKKDTLRQLSLIYADLVISTGSISAPINKILSSYLGAKSVVILKPNLPLRKFDLAILPEHDAIAADNVVQVKGALSYPVDTVSKAEECKDFFDLSGERKISVFIGASLNNKDQFLSNLMLFIKNLKDFSSRNNYRLLVSTSRRTDEDIEGIIERELKNFENCEAIVYANRQNYDFVFEGFIGLSSMVFVTSESISMMSEIISLQKPCISVVLEGLPNKHARFLESLEKEVIILNNPYNLEEIKLKESFLFEENRRVIKEAIKRVL